MGINVVNGWVQIDDSHNKLVNTTIADNPTFGTIEGLDVHYIFSRNKTHNKDGDGNPLIYAMKSIKNFKIVPMYRTKVIARATTITHSICEPLAFDAIVLVPSSNGFAREIAEIAAAATGAPIVEPDFIRKKTLREMYEQYSDKPSTLTNSEEKHYNQQLSAWKSFPGKTFSMKEVPPQIRHLFTPFTISHVCDDVTEKNILLVDDILSSGSSILSAANVCRTSGATSVTGLCFLGALAS